MYGFIEKQQNKMEVMNMELFLGHEIREEKSGLTTVILHMKPRFALVEFSQEFGYSVKDKDESISQQAINYIKKNLPKTKVNLIKVMAGSLLVTTVLAAPLALGADNNRAHAADASITGSNLSVSNLVVGSFTAVILNGRTQNTFANIDAFTVTDPTGTGDGWNVVMKASQFSTGGATPLTLPVGSLTVATPSLTANDTGASDAAGVAKSGGLIDTGTGLKILSAPAGGGMGEYTTTFPTNALDLKLLPKDVRSGTYTSTISVTINSGP